MNSHMKIKMFKIYINKIIKRQITVFKQLIMSRIRKLFWNQGNYNLRIIHRANVKKLKAHKKYITVQIKRKNLKSIRQTKT